MSSQVRTNEERNVSNGEGERIVAEIDASSDSQRALEWAAGQGELTNVTLEIVAAWEWPSGCGRASILSDHNPEQDAQKSLESVVITLRRASPPGSYVEGG